MNVLHFSCDYIMKWFKHIRATAVCLLNYSMFFRDKRAVSKMLVLGIGIVISVAIALGAYYVLGPLLFSTPANPTPTPTPSPPDLQVWKIEIDTPEPRQYSAFQYSVWMVNVGGTKSGWYDLNICIKDTSHGEYYYKGPFRLKPVDPTYLTNQAVLVLEGECIPNEPGWYEISAQIIPVDFEDGDENNNIFTSQVFYVTY